MGRSDFSHDQRSFPPVSDRWWSDQHPAIVFLCDSVTGEFDYPFDKTANSKRLIITDHRGSVRSLCPSPWTYDKCNQGLFPLPRIKEYKYYPQNRPSQS